MPIYAEESVTRLLEVNRSGAPKGITARFEKLREQDPRLADGWLADHRRAVQWAQDLLSRRDTWCTNDTETNHFDSAAEIIEVSVIDGHGEAVLDQLVRPQRPSNPRTIQVHGITQDMLEGKPSWREIAPRLNAVFAKFNEVLIYNEAFERRLYEQTSFRHGAATILLPPVVTDPLASVAAFCGEWDSNHNGWRYPKLEGGHRAAGDCRQMIKIVELMASSPIDKVQ